MFLSFTVTSKHIGLMALALVLLLALVVRLQFVTGMVRSDDFQYAHAAYELAQGYTYPGGWEGISRWGFYAPLALLYHLLGTGNTITLTVPLACSLIGVLFVYGIGRLQAGEAAGLVAALLWSLLPLDIFLATDLLPDGAMTTFSSGGVFFLLLGAQLRGWQRWSAYAACALCLVWALLIKPLAVIAVFYLIAYGVWKIGAHAWPYLVNVRWFNHPRLRKTWPVAVCVALGAFLVFYVYNQPSLPYFITEFSETPTNLFDQLFERPAYGMVGPLMLTALVGLLALRPQENAALLLWTGVLYLYYEWGSIYSNPLYFIGLNRYNDVRNSLLVAAPLVVVSGVYLGRGLPVRWARAVCLAAALVVGLAANYYSSVEPLILQCAQWGVLLALVSPLWVLRSTGRWHNALTAVLLLFVGVGGLYGAQAMRAQYQSLRPPLDNMRQAAQWLRQQAPQQPVYVLGQLDALALNYYSDFELGYNDFGANRPQQRIGLLKPEQMSRVAAYVVVNGDLPFARPEGWKVIVQHEPVDRTQPALTIYQMGLP